MFEALEISAPGKRTLSAKRTDDFVDQKKQRRNHSSAKHQTATAIAAKGKPSANEEWLTFADDGYRGLFETIKTPIKYDAAKHLAHRRNEAFAILANRDITERKRRRKRLRIAKQNIATSLKTPLKAFTSRQ